MANTIKEKELKREWPVTEGLTGGTQKQEGRTSNLIAEEGSIFPQRKKVGM